MSHIFADKPVFKREGEKKEREDTERETEKERIFHFCLEFILQDTFIRRQQIQNEVFKYYIKNPELYDGKFYS